MDNLYSSFYLYRKYEIIGDELIDLGITSIDADGTQEPVVKEECDTQCGCPEPIYRWVQTEDTICLEVITRQVTGSPYCNGFNKYIDVTTEESIDGGETWEFASSSSTLIEADSPDCGYPIYRWTENGYTCVGNDLYKNNVKEQSTDAGETWTVVIPKEYSASTLVEADCMACSCTPPDGKYRFILDNSDVISAECDSTSAVTSADTFDYDLYDYRPNIISVAISECVTEIGRCTFYPCPKLMKVCLPNTLTYIDSQAFEGCTSLTSIVIPDSVAAAGWWVFSGCTSLSSITIPNIGAIGVEFCKKCTSLVSVNFGTGVYSIWARAFQDCTSLSSLTIPNNITQIDKDAFQGCTGVKNVSIGSGLGAIPGWFLAGSSLTSVTISEGVRSIGESAFASNPITSITLPSTITSIGEAAFVNCSNLQSVTILSHAIDLGKRAFNNTNECPIFVPPEDVPYYKAYVSWRPYGDRIFPIPNT